MFFCFFFFDSKFLRFPSTCKTSSTSTPCSSPSLFPKPMRLCMRSRSLTWSCNNPQSLQFTSQSGELNSTGELVHGPLLWNLWGLPWRVFLRFVWLRFLDKMPRIGCSYTFISSSWTSSLMRGCFWHPKAKVKYNWRCPRSCLISVLQCTCQQFLSSHFQLFRRLRCVCGFKMNWHDIITV